MVWIQFSRKENTKGISKKRCCALLPAGCILTYTAPRRGRPCPSGPSRTPCLPTAIRSCRLPPQSASPLPLVLASVSLSPNPWPEIGSFQVAVHLLCSLTRFACMPLGCLQFCVQRRRRRGRRRRDGVGGQGRGHPRHGHLLPAQLRAPGTIASRHLCFPARQIRIPLRPFPWIRRRRGHHRTRTHSPLFDSKARGQAAWTPTQHHHTLCVVPLRLRDLFTVAAGLGF